MLIRPRMHSPVDAGDTVRGRPFWITAWALGAAITSGERGSAIREAEQFLRTTWLRVMCPKIDPALGL
jgi:hypothetical protein